MNRKTLFYLILLSLFPLTYIYSQSDESTPVATDEQVQVEQEEAKPKPLDLNHIDKADFMSRLDNPAVIFKQFTDEEVKEMFLGKIKGGKIEQFLHDNPKIIEFVVRCLKDDHAMQGFMRIRKDKERLKYYLLFMVFLFVVSMTLNYFGNKDKNFVEKFLKRLLITISMFCLSSIGILLIFNKEIKPFIRIFKSVFLS
ncbi:MAG: hypothetical protein U0T83_11215 [Bacteriovoracaceae bacterium]